MRKEMEDQVMQSEAQIAQLRKKNTDAVNDLNDQLDQVQKSKSKYVQTETVIKTAVLISFLFRKF